MDCSVINTGKAKRGISGSTLKIIAMITMLIDHIGAVILARYINVNNIGEGDLRNLYYLLRYIGRIAFPIFIFLLIEGFKYTSNRWKYLLRLLVFAFISELPFDLALEIPLRLFKEGWITTNTGQNVLFTMVLGLLFAMASDKVLHLKKLDIIYQIPICIGIAIVAFQTGEFLCTDYAGYGVLAILAAYYTRKYPVLEMLAICLVLTYSNIIEAYAFVDVILIYFYNGKRGLKIKYAFYAFYPVHLFLLFLICLGMGI